MPDAIRDLISEALRDLADQDPLPGRHPGFGPPEGAESLGRALHDYLLRWGAVGRERAIRLADLATGLHTHSRQLQEAVITLHRGGIPICSSTANPPGLYVAADSEEWRAYLASLRGRALATLAHYGAARRCVPQIPVRQMELFS